MPTHGAQQSALKAGCNSTDVVRREPSVQLVRDDDNGRVWITTTTVRCTAARHDTISAYKNLGCRCPQATRRAVGYEKRRQAGAIAPNQPATMTTRRLQALAVIGWTSEHVGSRIGRHHVSVSEIRRGSHHVVTGATARAVHRLYRTLHDQPGPSTRSRSYAARMGWTGPSIDLLFFDIDEVAVRKACNGEPVELHRGERLVAVGQLRVRGISYPEIARLLRLDQRQVHRDLADLGLINHHFEETG